MSVDSARRALGRGLRRVAGPRLADALTLLSRGAQYARIADYLAIDGWLTVDEAITLYETARRLPSERPTACEIGSWVGKSAVVIARGLSGKRSPRLYCCDPFNADGEPDSARVYANRRTSTADGLFATFERNLRRSRVRHIVRPLRGYSHEVIEGFAEALDLLFIDGAHDHASVLADFTRWAPLVKPHGFLAFHDVELGSVDSGPARVVRECVLPSAAWRMHAHVDSLLVVQRVGEREAGQCTS